MKTSPFVTLGLYALSLKQDTTATCDGIQAFSKLKDLQTDNFTNRPYITYEPNFWLLDGNYKFIPENISTVHVGLMSLSMSDVDGNFTVPPVLTITFGSVQSIESLTIHGFQYSNDYPTQFNVKYYDVDDVELSDVTYYPADWEYSTDNAVADFKKIVITFYTTNKPYRYLRISALDYGELLEFNSADIKTLSVVEETSVLSTELPIGTMELTLHSDDADFSIVNPTGLYSTLKFRQPLNVYETVGMNQVFIGQFYLSVWESISENIIKFTCFDALGVLDTMTYWGNLWQTPETIRIICDNLFNAISMPYYLDPDLESETIYGFIGICTCREALQQIAFAAGAMVSCSRTGVIQINKTKLASEVVTPDYTITKAEKGMDQSLTLKQMVTGIDLTYHHYKYTGTAEEVFNGSLEAGIQTLTFTDPVYFVGATITGATIIDYGVAYININVAVGGTVTISAKPFLHTAQIISKNDLTLDAAIKPNVLSITDATMVMQDYVSDILDSVYAYYQQRYLQKMRLYAPAVEIGKSVLIDTLYNQKIVAIVEKMELNLSSGFIAQTEATGVIDA